MESFAATEQSHYASLALRMDALEARIDRVERRLGLLPAARAGAFAKYLRLSHEQTVDVRRLGI